MLARFDRPGAGDRLVEGERYVEQLFARLAGQPALDMTLAFDELVARAGAVEARKH